MKLLAVVGKHYYGRPDALEPMYLEFTHPLRKLGHHVDHFDHMALKRQHGLGGCGERFLEAVRAGGYDAVLYQTAGADHMAREAIGDAARYAPVIAWNSDDDWQWEAYTSKVAKYFSYMVTTYESVYRANRPAFPNLLLSQWGCLDLYADPGRAKDLGFTFAGWLYGSRVAECRYLRRHAGLRVFGLESSLARRGGKLRARLAARLDRWWPAAADRVRGRALVFSEINAVWNRSKISFTPMASSVNDAILQIKSRTFEMGCSGTLMLCQLSPGLDRYYEPGKEFVHFAGLAECAEKARYYLRHEAERARIADAYVQRTRAEHMWEHRFEKLFRDAGLAH